MADRSLPTSVDWRVPPIAKPEFPWRWIALALAFAVLKLWLASHLPIRALDADRDNLRYVILAANLFTGDTSYDAFALLRQPVYPAFIAIGRWLGVPLRIWQELGYLGGGAFLAAIVGGLYRRPRLAALCFGLYAFAPFSFHWNRQTLQEVFYLPTIALWLGCAIAAIECRGWRYWLGAIGGGCALALIWNTRPEGVLLVPVIAVVWGLAAIGRYREQNIAIQKSQRQRAETAYRDRLETEEARNDRVELEIEAQLEAQLNGRVIEPLPEPDREETAIAPPVERDWGAIVRPIALGLLATIVPVVLLTVAICASNAATFGIFATSDFKTPEFDAAYSALSRVGASESERRSSKTAAIVPVPEAARVAVYEVSPAFRELRPALETSAEEGWRAQSCGAGICNDYAGGFFFWALRDAVSDRGYYESPDRAAAFYTRLATEIETACETGELTCRSGVWGMVPALRWGTIPRWLGSIHRLTRQLWQTALPLRLDSGAEDIELRQRYYADITREPADFFKARSRPLNQRKDAAIGFLAEIYAIAFPIVLGLGVLGLALEGGTRLGRRFGKRQARDGGLPLTLLAIAAVAIGVRIVTIAYIDATSWPVGAGDRYLRPLWPLVWLAIVTGLSCFADRWWSILRPARSRRHR